MITEQGMRNFKEGKAPGHQGLATVYIREIARTSYKSLRAVLAKLGIQSRWVRNLAFIGANMISEGVYWGPSGSNNPVGRKINPEEVKGTRSGGSIRESPLVVCT